MGNSTFFLLLLPLNVGLPIVSPTYELEVSQNVDGRVSKVLEPITGVFLSYQYNVDGLLSSVSDSLNRKGNTLQS